MTEINRREALMGMVAMGAGVGGEEARAASGDFAGGPKVFAVSAMKPAVQPNGAEKRSVLTGVLATGEALRVHESHVPEGAVAPPLHVIQHSELIFVQEGTLEFVREGKVERAVAGDVVYVAFGTNHCIRNAGPGAARYKVLAVGGDVKK